MEELLDQFLLESRDLIAQATADLTALGHRADDREALDSAFRAIHTLKGSVAIFALAPAEQVLHRAEDVLERARKGTCPLDAKALAGLVACLDRVDHWVDDMERAGALPADADAIADRLIASLADEQLKAVALNGSDEVDSALAYWAEALIAREEAVFEQASTALTIFRYAPDRDCFFQGEDPLAIAMGVPDLRSLQISPVGGEWPQEIDLFACVSVLEGVSGADIETVRTAFRLVASQVDIAVIEPQRDVRQAHLPVRDGGQKEVLRVAASRIDALADGIGELMVAVNSISSFSREAENVDRELARSVRGLQASLAGVTARLRDDVSALRAVSLGSALRRLPRLAREIADSLGKPIAFTITGEDVEVDRQIADGLFEPLQHLLRNAIDHGAEIPEERKALGKPAECAISLRIRRDGDAIIAVLTDDGCGIDPAQLRAVAVARGTVTQDEAAALSDRAALALIFAPGFSTAGEVTAISGRGVGMDAVRSAIERLRGTIDVDSEVGAGTTFRMRLPVSALTTRLLVVEAADDRYGIALDQIVETVGLEEAALRPVGTGLACVLRGRTVPVFDLGQLLGAREAGGGIAKLLVTQVTGTAVAVRVDGFAERLDAFVRPPAGLLAAIPGFAGSTLMGDGNVLIVLDLPRLMT